MSRRVKDRDMLNLARALGQVKLQPAFATRESMEPKRYFRYGKQNVYAVKFHGLTVGLTPDEDVAARFSDAVMVHFHPWSENLTLKEHRFNYSERQAEADRMDLHIQSLLSQLEDRLVFTGVICDRDEIGKIPAMTWEIFLPQEAHRELMSTLHRIESKIDMLCGIEESIEYQSSPIGQALGAIVPGIPDAKSAMPADPLKNLFVK